VSEEIRERFARARRHVEERQHAGTPPDEIVEAHTDDVDEIVVGAFETALASSPREGGGVALVALGGYGRRDLAPMSDLDLLLLYRGWSSPDITSLNRDVMYPLWDSGRELGDRVREPRDVVRNLVRIDETSAVIDARFLAGDRGLYADLEGSVLRRIERGRAGYFKDLIQATRDRHKRYGHAGHLLEPNLRDSAGGLRDEHTLLWASKLLPGGAGIDGLVASGYLSELDGRLVRDARSFLLRLRIELHLLTGRHQDQLYLAEQDDVAKRLGYEGADGRAPADAMMQQLYGHARHVDAIVSSFWDRVTHSKQRRRRRGSGSVSIGDGCVLQDGRIEVVAVTQLREDPAAWLRVFRQAVRRGAVIGRGSLNRLHEEVEHTVQLSWTSEAREVFLDILQAGRSGISALEAMDSTGLLGALLPEWSPIRAFPQRDLYHRFTIDLHLLTAVGELAESRASDERELKDAWSRVGDPQPLFVATLLHDIGKGRDADHSVVGAELATAAAERMGLLPDRVSDVTFLVREHLTLASVATRRDLNEPRTIDDVVERVGDARRLAMLFLLTRADSLATGPEAWSSFRASLVRELYQRTLQRFEGAPEVPAEASGRLAALATALDLPLAETERLVGPMPDAWLAGRDLAAECRQLELLREPLGPREVRTAVTEMTEADEFVVVAPDRPGLFATIAGVLAMRGIDVHDAEIYTRTDGVALDLFRVMGTHGKVPPERWDRVREGIAAALDGSLDVDEALAQKAAQERRRRGPARARSAGQIRIDNSASQTHTVVEVHTEDRLGLLRQITKALADAGCDLSLAKVATYGANVVDAFYVRDLDGNKITDPDDLRRIDERLVVVVGRGEVAN
jgi:[protein-PII] uridylyltransferase